MTHFKLPRLFCSNTQLCSFLAGLLGTCLLALSNSSLATATPIIAVNEDILPDYYRFLQGRNPEAINYYGGPGARRDVIELVLLQQALRLGGFSSAVQLQAEQSYLRSLRDIADGRFITSAGLVWQSDIAAQPDAYYSSRALIKNGEFIVGIYTTPGNHKALMEGPVTDISRLVAVTSSQWKTDIKTLAELGIHHPQYSPNWVNMVRMLAAGRADITLAPFQQTPDMGITVNGIKLVPIPGVKVALAGSRHWPISRKHPDGQAFHQALEKGLAQLEERGTIRQAYGDCGFFHPGIADWRLLNPQRPGDQDNRASHSTELVGQRLLAIAP